MNINFEFQNDSDETSKKIRFYALKNGNIQYHIDATVSTNDANAYIIAKAIADFIEQTSSEYGRIKMVDRG